jgi:ubiquinone/menaquinone biosynthesis C-methylase UbiE
MLFGGIFIKNAVFTIKNQNNILDSKYDDLINQEGSSLSFEDVQERKKLLDKVDQFPILDVGTGFGWLAIVAAKYYAYQVISIDHDEHYIVIARENVKKYGVNEMITFKKIDATRIPYSDDFFGTVCAYQTLHHTRYPFKVIEEMFRVCKRKGRVIISELNEEGFDLYHGEYYEYPEEHHEVYNKRVLNIKKLRGFLKSISSEIIIKESKYTNLIDCVK